jgi:hypothetical protein
MYDLDLVKKNLQLVNNSLEENQTLSNIRNSLHAIEPSLLEKSVSIKMLTNDSYSSIYATQQIESIDYSKFKNHVFFDSAVNKVNFVLNKILNFPYDKDEIEYNDFINSLEGYSNYIYRNIFPKFKGYVKFNGNGKVMVKNQTGSFLERKNDDKIGQLMPKNRFSFNFWLKVDSEGFQNNQVVFKFFNNDTQSGLICFIEEINGSHHLNFTIINNDMFLFKKTKIILDTFQNITINVTSISNKRNITFFIDGNNADVSHESQDIMSSESFDSSLETINTRLVLGASENLSITTDQNYIFNNFKGSIDDFRYFSKIRSTKQVKSEMHSNIFSQNDLVCYLKFNEPGGDYTNSCICLDYSGNKLHGVLFDLQDNLITDTTLFKSSDDTPLILEREILSPVRNSRFPALITIHKELIEKAELYDKSNPNLIFKLMPKHYFLESADVQQLPVFSNTDYLKSSKDNIESYQPANNHLVNIVLIWAKFFDQLKLYIDCISSIVDVDYDAINNDRILGVKIPLICKLYGLNFSEIFPSSTKRKKSNEALTFEDIINDISIRKIQNQIWYKILINSKSILSSKGTINSINQIFSLLGVDNLENLSIREHSSNNDLSNFDNTFYRQKKHISSMSFLGRDLINVDSIFEGNNSTFSSTKPFIEIQNIKSSNNILSKNNFTVSSQNASLGFGNNFSIEYYFDYEKNTEKNNIILNKIQNLFRIDLINNPVVNCILSKQNDDSNLYTLNINIKPVINTYNKSATLTIENIDILSRENYICLTQRLTGNTLKYELYYAKANENHIADRVLIDSKELALNNDNIANLFSNQNLLSLRTGEYKYDDTTSQLFVLENTSFEGNISCIRTWSKNLSNLEVENHSKNIFNISEVDVDKTHLVNNFLLKNTNNLQVIDDPNVNNLKKISIENQALSRIDDSSGHFNQCFFSSKNNNIDLKSKIIYKEMFVYNKEFNLENSRSANRVNIISYSDANNKAKSNNFNDFPIYSVDKDFEYEKSNKFSLDFSIAKNINNDINRLLTSLDSFSDILNGNSLYEYDYNSLKNLKNMYFSRLSDDQKINYSSLLNVFRYLDSLMSNLIYNIIPSKTNFKGFNFVYESHILERSKYQHKNGDSRLSICNKQESKDFSREYKSVFRDKQYNNNRQMID